MSQPQMMGGPPPISPLSLVFSLHALLEAPLVFQGLWMPHKLPFLELTNTTLVILKLYAALDFGTCIAAVLVASLPEFLPGKRALAICFIAYHSVAATMLYQAPRFIPFSFGEFLESWKMYPETAWALAHALLSLMFMAWWQVTVPQAKMMRNMGQQLKSQ